MNRIGLEFEDDDDLEVVEFIIFGLTRKVHIRNDYFQTLDEVAFRRRYRLSRQCILDVLRAIGDRLEFPYDCNICVSPMNQLLAALRFYASGGHLQLIADFSGMHISTVSRIIRRVSELIANLYPQYIIFPNTRESIQHTQQAFFDIAGFPRVVGAIDCTHVKIDSPAGGEEYEIFRNRKSYFSINTQMISNANLKIVNVVARWPGSAHDSTIFNNCVLKQQFETNQYRNCILLGDSGYPNGTYLFTPLLNTGTPAEQLYNESHIRTRNTIERCFGVLKRSFPVLAYGCRLKLQTTLTVIVATAVLHNIAINMGDFKAPPIPEELDEHVLNQLIADGHIPEIYHNANMRISVTAQLRQQFINEYFGQLQ